MKNEKMLEMVADELGKVGIKKDQIDDKMLWGVMKLTLGMMKIKWSLKESGFDETEAKEKLDKIVKMVSEKDADTLHQMIHKGEDGKSCGCGDKGDN